MCFLHTLCVFRFPPSLTMMHLCITPHSTYWTASGLNDNKNLKKVVVWHWHNKSYFGNGIYSMLGWPDFSYAIPGRYLYTSPDIPPWTFSPGQFPRTYSTSPVDYRSVRRIVLDDTVEPRKRGYNWGEVWRREW